MSAAERTYESAARQLGVKVANIVRAVRMRLYDSYGCMPVTLLTDLLSYEFRTLYPKTYAFLAEHVQGAKDPKPNVVSDLHRVLVDIYVAYKVLYETPPSDSDLFVTLFEVAAVLGFELVTADKRDAIFADMVLDKTRC